ncbi:hypothetical protein WME79_28510 [Sorangium sp. So ce726]|uniref:hypothetical protein n=1 Tax=Sorangium sp. So ce726 TaxID=3133319 RepID=UPI003F61AA9A
MLPHITDEVWAWVYAEGTGQRSIHRAKWPAAGDFAEVAAPADAGLLELAAAAMAAVNKRKSELGASVGRVVTDLALGANAATLARLKPALGDVLAAVRAGAHELVERAVLADGGGQVVRFC